MNTHSLFVGVNISDAKVVLLQQVEMVADEVKQVLTLRIPLRRQMRYGIIYKATQQHLHPLTSPKIILIFQGPRGKLSSIHMMAAAT